ncbi:clostripain [Clostridiaceae bacterium 14S0207]|nr:clostripain [Clostridiaceae bacterium 14S0207]
MLKKKIAIILATALATITFMGGKTVNAAPITKNTKEINQKILKENKDQKVTILYYCDADNNLEPDLLDDIEEMKRGYNNNPNLNLIALVDRTEGFSNDSHVLGENFEDTRLYKIEHNSVKRLDGGKEFPEITLKSNYEANMGDPQTLKKFIDYGKANYKADKYVLIMANHGGGAKNNKKISRDICQDITNYDGDYPDILYNAEISDCLTEKQSVDLLVFDACLMGTAEVAYQYRPGNGGFSADTMVASSPSVRGSGLQYDTIFSRLKAGGEVSNEDDATLGGKEQCFDPATVTNEQLGALFIEEQRDSVNKNWETDQSLSFYDLSKVEKVKKSVDKLSVSLSKENKKQAIEKLRGTGRKAPVMHYFEENQPIYWRVCPYFDLYDLCEQIKDSKDFSNNIKNLATDVMNTVDEMIVYSFGGPKFKGKTSFKDSKNGLSIFLPDGDKTFYSYYSPNELTHWSTQTWYNSIDTIKAGLKTPYGKLSWCKDGQDPRINKVGNWFELLDSWFDKSNGKDGGVNHYQW